jgi:hypothetical protein
MEDLVIDQIWEKTGLEPPIARSPKSRALTLVTRDNPGANTVVTSGTWMQYSHLALGDQYIFRPSKISLGPLEFNWIGRAREVGIDDYDIENLTDIFSEIDAALHAEKFDQLQEAIELLPMEELAAELLVAVLRAACSGRPHMNRWKFLVAKVRSNIEIRGLNSTEALVGLS